MKYISDVNTVRAKENVENTPHTLTYSINSLLSHSEKLSMFSLYLDGA